MGWFVVAPDLLLMSEDGPTQALDLVRGLQNYVLCKPRLAIKVAKPGYDVDTHCGFHVAIAAAENKTGLPNPCQIICPNRG